MEDQLPYDMPPPFERANSWIATAGVFAAEEDDGVLCITITTDCAPLAKLGLRNTCEGGVLKL